MRNIEYYHNVLKLDLCPIRLNVYEILYYNRILHGERMATCLFSHCIYVVIASKYSLRLCNHCVYLCSQCVYVVNVSI